jgi:hypothetical protein
MSTLVRAFTAVALIGLLASAAHADGPLQARPGEVQAGPYNPPHTVQGVTFTSPTFVFATLDTQPNELGLTARVIIDLSQMQGKIGDLVDTIKLPTNECDHSGLDNVVARIWGKELTINGSVATLRLHGNVDVWACNFIGKTQLVNQPFDADLPFQLAVVDPETVALQLGTPAITLGGAAGQVLTIANIDINDRAKTMLEQAIGTQGLLRPLPTELQNLHPAIKNAEFLNNANKLAAEIDISADLEAESIGTLLLALQGLLPHSP